MLERVIKRNGAIEAADASKINRWMENLSGDIKDRLDWSSVVMEVFRECPEEMSTQDLQMTLSKKFVSQKTWPSILMAGRLYAIWHWKQLYGDRIPTVREMHEKFQAMGLMEPLGLSQKQYDELELLIDHQRDLAQAQFQIKQIIYKYGITNRVTKTQMETPQFMYMRMATALTKDEPEEVRMKNIKDFYDSFSKNKINAPSPNYLHLGTHHRGYASCCLIKADDNARSLAAADLISYTMTYSSSGIGRYLECRSLNDSVRNGTIQHQGKMPYYRASGSIVESNTQGGRGGAVTEYVTVFDPEIETIAKAQNPRTPAKMQIRNVFFNIITHNFFEKMAAQKKDIFLFNCYTAPDLHQALFSGDAEKFETLYYQYEADPTFKKTYINAWKLGVLLETQSHEVSTLFSFNALRANINTPFLEPVYQSNLCGEIVNITRGYPSAEWLYKTDHRNGEVGVCNIAAIVLPNVKSDKDYEQQCYLALKMIDKTIHMASYELPHIGYMAKQRLNAAVGVVGVAQYFAERGIKFDSPYGLEVAHQLAERHLYFLVKASLRLAKELGNAPLIDETKWPTGWMPFDNYAKGLDTMVPHKLRYDWETLRQEVIAQGGIRNSTLVAHMPTESSSKASGVPNGLYPIRDKHMKKTDQNATIDWFAPDDDLYGDHYQSAYEVDNMFMYAYYGAWQKFCDQSISADGYEDRVANPVLTEEKLIQDRVWRAMFGVVTKYYQNTFSGNQMKKQPKPAKKKQVSQEQAFSDIQGMVTTLDLSTSSPEELEVDTRGCAGGACTL